MTAASIALLHDQPEPVSAGALAWAQEQGFTVDAFNQLAASLGIGESSEIPGALQVPYLEDGKPVGWQLRRYVGDPGVFAAVRTVGQCDRLYNVNALKDPALKDQPIIVADSILSCWAFLAAGFRRTVAVPFLKPIAGRRWECVDASRPLWEGSQIILAMHDDAIGTEAREDLAAQFGRARCRWLRWPKGCLGAESTFRQHGARGLTAAMDRAAWFAVPDIYRLSELPEPTPNPALDIGIVGLAEHYRVRRGDVTVVSGVPNCGKTTFVNEVVCRLVERHQWRVVFASFEQRPKPDHRRALRTFHAQKLERDMSPDEKAAADTWIEENFLFLKADDAADTDLGWLLDRLEMAVERIGASVVVLDPWNELEHVRPAGVSMTEYTGVAIRQLKRFATRHRVHLIVVAHPAKMQRNQKGEYPKPTLYDIADSAHWFNKPDVGIMLYRAAGTTETEIMVCKSRYWTEIGRPGSIKGVWDEHRGRFTIVDDGAMGWSGK